jgi:hypothetical protein
VTRKLDQADQSALRDLVCRQPSLNIWIIADLENHGLEKDFQELWGGFVGVSLRAVVLRFHSHFVVYSAEQPLPDGILEVLSSPRLHTLSGAADIVGPIASRLGFSTVASEYLAELTHAAFRPCRLASVDVQPTGVEDAEALHALGSQVAEFAAGRAGGLHGIHQRRVLRLGHGGRSDDASLLPWSRPCLGLHDEALRRSPG